MFKVRFANIHLWNSKEWGKFQVDSCPSTNYGALKYSKVQNKLVFLRLAAFICAREKICIIICVNLCTLRKSEPTFFLAQ